jgi:hypothetical protein
MEISFVVFQPYVATSDKRKEIGGKGDNGDEEGQYGRMG